MADIGLIYDYAKKVYNNEIDKKTALDFLSKNVPDKEKSHGIYIQIYKNMLDGSKMTRTASTAIITFFLQSIANDNDVKTLKNALETVKDNIIYRYKDKSDPSNKLRNECQKICKTHGVDTNFSDEIFEGITVNTVRQCWFVGAQPEEKDHTQHFIDNNTWWCSQPNTEVTKVKVGDKIAIKSAYSMKHNLPFKYDGNKRISVMEIKAIGTVTQNYNDGMRLDVEWEQLDEPKLWYIFVDLTTIWNVRDSYNWKHKALLDFTFKDITQDYKRFLSTDETSTTNNISTANKQYTKDDFLSEVFIDEKSYDTLSHLLKHKKNVIIQGAPGVGKTYAAKRLAYSIMGTKDDDKIKFVQFHQSYSYEDFVAGYRPTENGGFNLIKGPFYNFCKTAQNDPDNQYFFIIDEINRGNLSKIFGELLMLIEADKRGEQLTLIYNDEPFSVPENIHIIGMMNTADRSLALMDYALRRRFAFFTFNPAFANSGFKQYQQGKNNIKFDKLINAMTSLNQAIADDTSLGHGFQIGHSYFCIDKPLSDEHLHSIVDYEIAPLLEEYWFDDTEKKNHHIGLLKAAINE